MLAGLGGEVDQVSRSVGQAGSSVRPGTCLSTRSGSAKVRAQQVVVRRHSPSLYRASTAQTNRGREAPTKQSLGRAGQQKVDTANHPWPQPTVR
jgi:hypothetical protein